MRKFLAILLVIVLCLGAFALVACDHEHIYEDGKCTVCGADDPDYSPAPAVPTETGKVTIYFTLAEGSAEQLPIASYFMTGGLLDDGEGKWATGADSLEFTNLEGTDVYYVVTDKIPNPAGDKGLEYQLLVGYNASSGLPASEQGVKWVDDRKSDVSAAPGGLDNPSYEFAAGQETIDLGTHKFGVSLSVPKSIDTTLRVFFAEELPEGYEVRIVGSINNWDGAWTAENDAEKYLMVPSADRKSATIALNDVLLGNYAFKIVIYMDHQEVKASTDVWTGAAYGNEDGSDATLKLGSLDDGDIVDLLDSRELELPYAVDITIQVTFSVALAEGSIVHVYGGFQGWGYRKDTCELTSTDGKVWTMDISKIGTGDIAFKIIVYPAGTTDFGWDKVGADYYGDGDGDFKATLTLDSDGGVIEIDITVEA